MDEIKRLTPAQRARCNRLIRRLCANYDGGNCLPLDDGEGCVCVQMISYSLLCKYFRRAVLPAHHGCGGLCDGGVDGRYLGDITGR